MDREEILKHSRAEKEDEGSTFLENRAAARVLRAFAACLLRC